MILSDLSIKRPVFAAVLMLALVTLGIFSYRRLSVEMFPSVEIPVISIVTKFPGASPESIEREVSKKIEEAVNQIAGVKHVMSFSREGVSTVMVEFRLEEKINEVSQEARAKINGIRGNLPTAIEDPIIQKLDFNALPVASIAVKAKGMSPKDLTTLVEKKVKRRLENVSGVGKVDMVGSTKREVTVTVDPARLDALGLGVDTVVAGLKSENVNTPLGRLTHGGNEYPIRISGKPDRVEGFRNMVIAQRGGRGIALSEVADISDGAKEQRSLALINGEPAVALDILKQSGANMVEVVDGVKKSVEKLRKDLPPGVELTMVRDASIPTRESLADVKETMLIGGLLTVIIVFCFINSWRSTVITGLTLPISVISSFIIMNAMGMTLNVMTLMALSLAIGLLIDDAIVVRENIVRHLEHGKDHITASKVGTSEIGLAVFATSMSIIAVFVPVAFMRGIVGRFFFQFGMTVAFAVLVSLFVSFTLDPMLSSRWHDPAIALKGRRKGLAKLLDRFNDRFDAGADSYKKAISWALKHRKSVLGLAFASFVAGIVIFGTLESSFMTNDDKGEFQVGFKTAPDASISETSDRLKTLLASVSDVPEVEHTYASIGAGDSGTVQQGSLYVKLKEKAQRKRSQEQVQQEFRSRLAKIPGVTTSIERVGDVGGAQKPLQVNLKGEDIPTLKRYAAQLKKELYQIPGLVDIEVTLDHDIPEYRMTVDRQRAQDAGVNTNDIASTVSRLVGGEAVSTYEDEDGDAVDVRVRLPESLRRNPGQVRDLKLAVAKGGDTTLVPLGNLTRYEVSNTPSEINRRDLSRLVTISANLDGIPIGTAVAKVKEAAARVPMQPGYSVGFSGEAEDMAESFGYMAESLIIAIVFVYLILAAQFESFLEPMAIMLSLPLSIVGMAGMLKLTGDTVNIMSLIGLIMLMGLVTKNAILLVDYAKVLQQRGASRFDAVVEAGRTRLRPIVMTTLAMIFGMMPLFFALGSGAEMRAPMARAVVGGLLTSTILTLLVVPVMYTVLDDFQAWLKRKWKGKEKPAQTALLLLLAVTLSIALLPQVSGAAEARTLTLDDALAIAMDQNRDIQKARAYAQLVHGRYLEERAAALPSLSLTGSASWSNDDSQSALLGSFSSTQTGTGSNPATATVTSTGTRGVDLRMSQTLFNWGKIGAAIRGAAEGLKTAEDQLRLYQQAARRDTSVAFYDVLLAKELRALAQSNLRQKERHLAEAQRRLSAGVATDYDVLAAQVGVENARPEVIRSDNRIRTARERLRLVLALDQSDLDVTGTLEAAPVPPPRFEESLTTARRMRPELAELRHRVGISRELVKIAQADNKPQIDLRGGVGWHQFEMGGLTSDGAAWDIGVYLTFPFFDGFKTKGKVEQAESDLRTRELDEAQQLDSVSLQVRDAGFGVTEAEEIVAALGGTVKQAERLLAMAEQGYELGVKTRLEVEDAEANLVQARGNLAQARRDYQVSLVNLAWSTGVLGEH
jgi:hydrophobic/amphiphilic exporter-1 (mainly G- bacteria), HAE1 family